MADKKERKGGFKIIKWYLDFVGENGEAMIFYAAEIYWKGLKVPYASIHMKVPGKAEVQKTSLKKFTLPQIDGASLSWSNTNLGLQGLWEQQGQPLNACLFASKEGSINWNCWQPSSRVTLTINRERFEGMGYAEELILTVPAWKIPMRELRWGRSLSEESYTVWIEIKGDETRKWLWHNGERMSHFEVSDSQVVIHDKQLLIKLDQAEVLEHEQKIYNVVKSLVRYLPGFKKIIPTNFLMAEGYKWFSQVTENHEDGLTARGSAIHEYVNFNG